MGPGEYKGKIVSHRSRMLGDSLAIAFACEVGTEKVEAMVFITDKAMSMARRALKVCGFDVDKNDLAELDFTPKMLAGREVPLVAEFYKGRLQFKINLDSRAEKDDLERVTQQLRAAKKNREADGSPDSEPQPTGKGNEDLGDIPFAWLIALPLLGLLF